MSKKQYICHEPWWPGPIVEKQKIARAHRINIKTIEEKTRKTRKTRILLDLKTHVIKFFDSKYSKSSSDIWHVRTDDQKNLIVKIFVSTIKCESQQCLLFEQRVYKKIQSCINDQSKSPNFVTFVDEHHNLIFSDLQQLVLSNQKKKSQLLIRLRRNIRWITCMKPDRPALNQYVNATKINQECKFITNDMIRNELKFSATITEKTDSVSLSDLLFNPDVNIIGDGQINPILFQIIFSTFVMHDAGIQHNDLHWNNILVETLDEEKEMTFVISNNNNDNDKDTTKKDISLIHFTMTTKYIPKIFDYDKSTMKTYSNPHYVNLHEDDSIVGYDNVWSPGRDLIKFAIMYNKFFNGEFIDIFVSGKSKQSTIDRKFLKSSKRGYFQHEIGHKLEMNNFMERVSQSATHVPRSEVLSIISRSSEHIHKSKFKTGLKSRENLASKSNYFVIYKKKQKKKNKKKIKPNKTFI